MPAPKNNQNAAKENPKTKQYCFKLRPENYTTLKEIAKGEKISVPQVIEKALLAMYPKKFSGKF